MRIAYLFSRYPVVSQTFCDSEMLALEALGFDLEIVSLNPPPDSFRHERLDRLRAGMHYSPPEKVLDARANEAAFREKLGAFIDRHDKVYGVGFKTRVRARNAWQIAPLLRRLGVTHVHVHFANRATHTALALKQLGFTFSFTPHAQDFMVDLGSDDLLREMKREAEFTVAVSDFSRKLLLDICPGEEKKIVRIYNGIELDTFPPAEPSQTGPLRVVGIGRLIEFKGFQHLIGAMALLKKRGIAAQARIIGEGPLRDQLQAQIAEAGLEDSVVLAGSLSQESIKRELASANLFVLPSIVDGKGASDILPTVITEAMACRLPVVSTTLAGIPEMVADGDSGLLVNPGDKAALADAMQRVLSDAHLAAQFGSAGRKRAETLFALSVTAGTLAEKFRSLPTAASRLELSEAAIVYLMAKEGVNADQLRDLPNDPCLRLLCANRSLDESLAVRRLDLEFVPDASVVESLWLRRPAWRQTLEKLRGGLGDSVSGEEFYTQARLAIWMADALPRQGVKHLHAYRSDTVIAVWLWKNLTGLSISAAIEDTPTLSRAVLHKILGSFDKVSVSDPKFGPGGNGVLPSDTLQLKKPVSHRIIPIGPLRLKKRVPTPVTDRKAIERQWFQSLLGEPHA